MNRPLFRALALILAIGLQTQVARAQDNNNLWTMLFGHQDPRLTVTGIGLGLGADAEYLALRHKHGTPPVRYMSVAGAYAITTAGCIALYPIIGTMWLNRPLSTREAWTGMADCVVPFIGGWIVEASFHGQPWYEAGTPGPMPVARHHRHHQ